MSMGFTCHVPTPPKFRARSSLFRTERLLPLSVVQLEADGPVAVPLVVPLVYVKFSFQIEVCEKERNVPHNKKQISKALWPLKKLGVFSLTSIVDVIFLVNSKQNYL
jgi:hypothetical protein